TLAAIMKAAALGGGVPLAVALKIVSDICQGIHVAHELTDDDGRPLGLVHRDVSPPNILVNYSGEAKLADFGVAKASQLDAPGTQAGVIKGKFRYMAPEQFSTREVDRRTDVFSLGIILYQLTTGQHPWGSDTGAASLQKIASRPPAPPT